MENVSLFGAFIAGVLSFISPCVLPLIPGYLSFISGVSLEEMRGMPVAAGAGGATFTVSGGVSAAAKRQVIITSLFFVLGFSLVFVSLGASATYLGQFLMERLTIFGKIAGVLLIIFGLHTIGVFKIPFLLNEARVQANTKPASMLGAVIVGISFAFGWTPCIGPILGGILVIAGSKESVSEGVALLAVYSAGLGVPFVLTALAMDRFFLASARIRKHYKTIERVSGGLLILLGVLILTNQFSIIVRYLDRWFPWLTKLS